MSDLKLIAVVKSHSIGFVVTLNEKAGDAVT